MNEYWKAIVDALKPASVTVVFLAAIAHVARGMFGQWLKQDLVAYKAELNRATAEHKADLDRMAFEHQTRYASLHKMRADVIAEMYRHLRNIEDDFSRLVGNAWGETGELRDEWDEVAKPLVDHVQAFLPCFREKRIYLDEPLCKRIDEFVTSMQEGYVAGLVGRQIADVERRRELVNEHQTQLSEIRREIEAKFRSILGVPNESE